MEIEATGGNYDVYLSFRGLDTRNTLTSFLYELMVGAGIRIFRDDEELRPGLEISHVLSALERSHIYIPIFSKNYASSKWCLEELAKIVNCYEQSVGKHILPIFYDVDPSDVKLHTELYRSHLKRHEAKLGTQVKIWEEALLMVGRINGWSMKNQRHGEVIQKIIQDVLQIISLRERNLRTHLVGSHDRMKDLRSSILADIIRGRKIGKLIISSTKIGKGSNGTIVFEGSYEGRAVAVKRLVLHDDDEAARNEISNLIACDRHPNIVRYYGMESDQDFVYLALERCTCSLGDLIQALLDSPSNPVNSPVSVDSIRNEMQGVQLWNTDEHRTPTPLLLKLMRDMVSGLAHLHYMRFIHRDLKPQNVLITKNRSLDAQLSDMGLSKCLPEDESSLGYYASGLGSLGWRAPEQLCNGRQTRAIDVFSLGCVLFFCITRGKHPFGRYRERDINIEDNKMDLSLVEFIPEAHDLISRMLNQDLSSRPKALEVLNHPFFWNSERRLSFLLYTNGRIQEEVHRASSSHLLNYRAPNLDLLNELERKAALVFGISWADKIDSVFFQDIESRYYDYSLLRDLLRAFRNKHAHYSELSEEIKKLIGSVPEGYVDYFTKRFPQLLMVSYGVVSQFCKDEEDFRKYFGPLEVAL